MAENAPAIIAALLGKRALRKTDAAMTYLCHIHCPPSTAHGPLLSVAPRFHLRCCNPARLRVIRQALCTVRSTDSSRQSARSALA